MGSNSSFLIGGFVSSLTDNRVAETFSQVGQGIYSEAGSLMAFGHGHEEKIHLAAQTVFFGAALATGVHAIKQFKYVKKMDTRLDKILQGVKATIMLSAAVSEAVLGYFLPRFTISEAGQFGS